MFVRISATDWTEQGLGFGTEHRVFCKLKNLGIDLIDVSSGGAVPGVRIRMGLGYQVSFAAAIRRVAGIVTGAVGTISVPAQAETIISTQQADVVLLAREFSVILIGRDVPPKRLE